jgi:hypothetical protein
MSEKKKTNRMTFEEIQEDYPNHVFVPGSLTFLETESKQAVRIVCSVEGCERTRLLRTSDLHQQDKCEACHRKAKRERQREKRRAKREEENKEK